MALIKVPLKRRKTTHQREENARTGNDYPDGFAAASAAMGWRRKTHDLAEYRTLCISFLTWGMTSARVTPNWEGAPVRPRRGEGREAPASIAGAVL
jgi:hypothetical protein